MADQLNLFKPGVRLCPSHYCQPPGFKKLYTVYTSVVYLQSGKGCASERTLIKTFFKVTFTHYVNVSFELLKRRKIIYLANTLPSFIVICSSPFCLSYVKTSGFHPSTSNGAKAYFYEIAFIFFVQFHNNSFSY